MPEYIHVKSEPEYEAASLLFKEYAAWLDIDLSFQKFSEELLTLKEMYGPPYGGIILAKTDHDFIGCIAIRKINADTAELKRMYVRTTDQQQGTGKALLEAALELAQKYGYQKIQLDTLGKMEPAIRLYKRYGFYEIPAYYYNPEKTVIYFEKIL